MYQKIDPKEAGIQAVKDIMERLGSCPFDTAFLEEVSGIVENTVFNIQSDFQQREYLLVTENDELTQKNTDLQTSLKAVLEMSFDKEHCYLEILKMVHKSLETSCKFDEDSGVHEREIGDPEKERYEDLLLMKNRIKKVLNV